MVKLKWINVVLGKMLHSSSFKGHVPPQNSRRIRFIASAFSCDRSLRSWCCSHHSWESVSDSNHDSKDDCWSSSMHDVPRGCLPVYVGKERRRFVIPMSYLSDSVFRALLAKSEEEYGLRCEGGLRIACSPDVFEHFLWWLEGETTHFSEEMEHLCSGSSRQI